MRYEKILTGLLISSIGKVLSVWSSDFSSRKQGGLSSRRQLEEYLRHWTVLLLRLLESEAKEYKEVRHVYRVIEDMKVGYIHKDDLTYCLIVLRSFYHKA